MPLATIERIKQLIDIPGADRILAARVLEYWTIVKKGEFQTGDLCIWHNPDTIVDSENPIYEFLRKNNFRIKAMKMKGQISQGLALAISNFNIENPLEGMDVTDIIKIKKYEKNIPAELAGIIKAGFPSFLEKTDETNLRSNPRLHYDILCYNPISISIKMDGTSATYYLKDGQFGVCSRNLELEESQDNVYWKMAVKYNIKQVLESLSTALRNNFVFLQGEICGPGIQKNRAGLTELELFIFNFGYEKDNRIKFEDPEAFIPIFYPELKTVKCLEPNPNDLTIENLLAEANSLKYKNGHPIEGLVIRSYKPNGEKVSGKIISDTFCLEAGE
jgi:RNA ligase (TIGR02306 family)